MSETWDPGAVASGDEWHSFETTDGETVFYDGENANAWLQVSQVVDVGDAEVVGPTR